MKMKWMIIISVFLSSLSCTKQMARYVTSDPRSTPPETTSPPDGSPTPPPGSSTSNSNGSKFSSGANIASGTHVKSKFSISPANRTVSGQSVKSTFTLYQNRPN